MGFKMYKPSRIRGIHKYSDPYVQIASNGMYMVLNQAAVAGENASRAGGPGTVTRSLCQRPLARSVALLTAAVT